MAIRFNNYAREVGRRGERSWYRWRVFVDEPPAVLARIESVDYVLHATFPNPNRTAKNSLDRFALESSGWGEFDLFITVHFRDGSTEEAQYWLDLRKSWGATTTSSGN